MPVHRNGTGNSIYSTTPLASLYDRIAPPAIDVQVDSRLVRIERHQAEYWVLSLMLAGIKTQWSKCCFREQAPCKFAQGFFAEQLHQVLSSLPVHLWKELRRKCSYVNQVLARGEVKSRYTPARRLWCRTRNGHYFPNPDMLLRKGEDWQPVYERLYMPWIDMGSSTQSQYGARPLALITHLRDSQAEKVEELF